uniref:Uncharacterized protein n=1 Tax=Avena sativa TaxID=4498 RepID=A0ACD5YVR9_AVESA
MRLHVALASRRRGQRNENLNSVPHGPHWRALRRNLTAETLHPSRLGCLAPLQREAVQDLVATLSSKGAVKDLRTHLYGAVFSVVARMCFGAGVDGRHVRALCRGTLDFQLAIGVVRPFSRAGSVVDKLVEWRRLRRLFAIDARLKEMFLPLIAARGPPPRTCDDGGRRPYVDALVDLRIANDDGDKQAASNTGEGGRRALRDDEMVSLIQEFLGAGTGTVAASLEWALAHLVEKPEVQEKLRREVDAEAAVSLPRGGAASMPYLQAVVLETLRMHPPLPVIPRHVQADTAAGVLGGTGELYVNFAVADMGRDSRTWTNPDEFQPERFLAGGEAAGVGSLPGPKEIRMMPFGAGNRFCPGVGMAMVNMKCFLAALVREFEWAPSSADATGVDLTELDGFFKEMKTPLSACVTRRNQSS